MISCLLDSDVTTDDEWEKESEPEPKDASKAENGSGSESEPDDGVTSRFRLPLPLDLIQEAEKTIKSHGDDATVTVAKEPSSAPNENAIAIDSVADSVLRLFARYGLNPANLSDEQVQQYIELVVKESTQPTGTAKESNDRAGSVETLTSSDSNDDSWRFV